MGFGMKPELYKKKPKRFMGKRTGLFGRQLKDELQEHYHHDQPNSDRNEDNTSITKKRKGLFYKGGPDRYIEIIAVGLIIAVVLFLVYVWKNLSN
jgi:hypothetical protein